MRKSGRPSRIWPDTLLGNLIYLVSLAAASGYGYSLWLEENNPTIPVWVYPVGVMFCALMAMTIWRNLFINAGALSPVVKEKTADGQIKRSGGIGCWSIIWVVIGVAAVRIVRQIFWQMP